MTRPLFLVGSVRVSWGVKIHGAHILHTISIVYLILGTQFTQSAAHLSWFSS